MELDDKRALDLIARILQEPEWDGDTLENIYGFVEATGRPLKTPYCPRCEREHSPNNMVEYDHKMICFDCLTDIEVNEFVHQVVR